jgi:hypothetical protein
MSGTVVIKKKPWFWTPWREDGVFVGPQVGNGFGRVIGSGSGFKRWFEDIKENK